MRKYFSAIISMISAMIFAFSPASVYADADIAERGYTAVDDTYIPRNINYATREEAIAEFVKAVGTKTDGVDKSVLKRFSDGSKTAAVYADAIAYAVKVGAVSGYEDGTFRPQSAITRTEALVILSRMLDGRTLPKKHSISFSDVPKWAKNDLDRLAAAGLVKGYGNGNLGGADLLTTEQTAVLAKRAARLTGPCGDYYEYVNNAWLENTDVPAGEAAVSDMTELQKKTKKQIGEIIYSLYRRKYRENESFPQGSSEQKIADVFAAAGNTAYRDSVGVEPAMKYLKLIDDADNMYSLLKAMAELEKSGFHGLLPLCTEKSAEASGGYTVAYSGNCCGAELENIHEVEKRKLALSQYEDYAKKLFELYGYADENEITEHVQNAMEILSAINATDAYAEENVYCSAAERRRIFTHLDSDKYFGYMGFPTDCGMNIYNLNGAETADRLWSVENKEKIKDYLRLSVMDGAAMYLSSENFEAKKNLNDAINGYQSNAVLSDYAILTVEELLKWDLAKIYTEKYASAEDKIEAEKLTNKVVFAYKELVRKTPWMTEQTKKNAVSKIEKMKIHVGYPDDTESYTDSGYEIKSIRDGGSLLEYKCDYAKRCHDADVRRIRYGEAAKDAWTMLPQTVNAMYDPSTNTITIPSAILSKPIYDGTASFETNLGGLGSIIAHEVSHALDSEGSKFDENGNLKNWWSERDKNAFDGICREVEEAYDAIEVLPNVYIDGKRTLKENLADIAGMECILKIAGEDNPRLGELFESYAAIWRMKTNDDYINMQLKADVHSPDKVRVNRVLSNFAEFERFYHIEKDDEMYIPPEERIKIWR